MAVLNLANVPNNMISGLESDVLDWVTMESNERELVELSGGFLAMLNEFELSEEITEELSIDIMQELDKLEKDSIPASCMKQMNSSLKRLEAFLKKHKLNSNVMNIPKKILNTYLRFFYSELRQLDGSFYAPPSLICIRAGLHRYFSIHRPDINIIADTDFNSANRMLKTMVAKYKRSNQTKTKEYPCIEKEDMKIIRQYFDRSNPVVLQEEIIFNLIYYFSLRGRESLPYLSKNSIEIKVSSTGKRYLQIVHELLSKNAKASLNQKEYEDIKQARAYEDLSTPSECPVVAWEKYMSLIEGTSSLFPKPCKLTSKTVKSWYTANRTVGKNSIDSLMSNLSLKLNLSKRYTNHCLRVTFVTILKENGFSNSDICKFTGHKNPQSVERYNRKRRDGDFEDMSAAIQLGASSSSVKVHKVSKQARIVVQQSSSSVTTSQVPPSGQAIMPPNFHFHFNGEFHPNSINIKVENQ